jgi:hypothetical protein
MKYSGVDRKRSIADRRCYMSLHVTGKSVSIVHTIVSGVAFPFSMFTCLFLEYAVVTFPTWPYECGMQFAHKAY